MKRILALVVLAGAALSASLARPQSNSSQIPATQPPDVNGAWMGALDRGAIDDLRRIAAQIKKDEDVGRYLLAFSLVFGLVVALILHFSRRDKSVNTHAFLPLEAPHRDSTAPNFELRREPVGHRDCRLDRKNAC